ncbi:recombination regulator RecX, partial [Acidovorax sp. SRB_24]
RSVWDKRFGAAPADAKAWARQVRFLTARGFAADVVRRVVPVAPR